MDYYEILGVSPHASYAEIERAYRKRKTRYHLDRCLASDLATQRWAGARTLDLNEAHAVLSNPRRRGLHDREGAGLLPKDPRRSIESFGSFIRSMSSKPWFSTLRRVPTGAR